MGYLLFLPPQSLYLTCTQTALWFLYTPFINTSDSFAIPIGGEHVTCVYINLCLWPVQRVEPWAWHAILRLCLKDSFFITIGREQRPGQLCHITRYARRARHSLKRSCLSEGGGGPYHFIAWGVLCWKKSLNNYNVCIIYFLPKVFIFLTEKVFINGNQSVLNLVSTSGLNPPMPGS